MYQDEFELLQKQHGNNDELIHALLAKQRFGFPEGSSFWNVHKRRHEAGNGQRIDVTLNAIEETHGSQAAQGVSKH